MRILAGDIGGTKTRLALYTQEGQQFTPLAEETYSSTAYDTFEGLLEEFRDHTTGQIDRACFGIAGPIIRQRCKTTNLPWVVDGEQLKSRLSIDQLWLINDLEATAWGIPSLGEKDILTLQTGNLQGSGNACIIAAGTGLGEAGLYDNGTQLLPFATEGGHSDFAPKNPLEYALNEYLARSYQHVSWERLVSGPGLVAIYQFLHQHRRCEGPAPNMDPAAISAAALNEECPICSQALELFVSLYGAETGNLALKSMATGGVFVGGGIAPKILPAIQAGGFLQAFNAKGRMSALMESMPVKVILNDKAALYGPARFAAAQSI